jgi:membrane associated rhomboid family serine protease
MPLRRFRGTFRRVLPIGDRNPTRTTPFVNYCLLALNLAVYAWQFSVSSRGGDAWLVPGYGLVPARLTGDPFGEVFTVFTSMFMHGNFAHLGGNMLFLYIFGDNVEDSVGHLRYVFFYLLSGIGAAAAQVLIDPSSQVPMVGASGAIAGVLGAYMVLHPRAPITVLNPPPLAFFIGFFIEVPAWLVIGAWFVIQLLSGVGSLGGAEGGGVAFFAHVGGFLAGLLLVRPLHAGRPRRSRDDWSGWRPPERVSASRRRWN